MPMFRRLGFVPLLALLVLGLSAARPPHASALEWDLGVAAHTGAHGEVRPCT